jgi:hypothetical protein
MKKIIFGIIIFNLSFFASANNISYLAPQSSFQLKDNAAALRLADKLARKYRTDLSSILPFIDAQNIPEGYVPIIHFTNKKNLNGIAAEGIKYREEMRDFDREFDQNAGTERLFSREGSIYAYYDIRMTKDAQMGIGQIPLVFYVDPNRVFVTDAHLFNEYNYSGHEPVYAKNYSSKGGRWHGPVTLAEYLKKPEYYLQIFEWPEIVIPPDANLTKGMLQLLDAAGDEIMREKLKKETPRFIKWLLSFVQFLRSS